MIIMIMIMIMILILIFINFIIIIFLIIIIVQMSGWKNDWGKHVLFLLIKVSRAGPTLQTNPVTILAVVTLIAAPLVHFAYPWPVAFFVISFAFTIGTTFFSRTFSAQTDRARGTLVMVSAVTLAFLTRSFSVHAVESVRAVSVIGTAVVRSAVWVATVVVFGTFVGSVTCVNLPTTTATTTTKIGKNQLIQQTKIKRQIRDSSLFKKPTEKYFSCTMEYQSL